MMISSIVSVSSERSFKNKLLSFSNCRTITKKNTTTKTTTVRKSSSRSLIINNFSSSSATNINASKESIERAKESGLVLAVFNKDEVLKVREELKSKNTEELATVDDSIIDWFVRDRKLDEEQALKKILKYQNWRDGNFSIEALNAQSVVEEAKTGKAVLMDERDILGRPVVLVTLIKHDVGTRVLEDTQKLCVKLLDEGLAELKAEGFEQETVMCVYDLRGFSMKNADIDFTKFFISCIFDYYPKRISQVLLVDAPFVFKPVWAIIKPLMGKYSSLVKFVKAKEANEFFTSDPF